MTSDEMEDGGRSRESDFLNAQQIEIEHKGVATRGNNIPNAHGISFAWQGID
jgi:hypothetical protein